MSDNARSIAPYALPPAVCQYLRDDQQELAALSATLVSMAVKGYLTIEETEPGAFMLQRTWREGDLGLDSCEKAVAHALYAQRPARFFIMGRNGGLIAEALDALQEQTNKHLIRIAQNFPKLVRWLFMLVLGIVGIIILLFEHAAFTALLGGALLVSALILLDRVVVAKHYTKLYALQQSLQQSVFTQNWLARLYKLYPNSILLFLSLSLFGLGLALLLFSASWLALLLFVGIMIFLAAVRWRSLTSHATRAGLNHALARYDAYLAGNTASIDTLADPSPEHFQQGLPYALALGHEAAWGQRFDVHQNAYKGWRPRWIATPRQNLSPTALANLLGIGLTAALLQAMQTMVNGDVVADGDGPEVHRMREGRYARFD